jgi:hypothetical protein
VRELALRVPAAALEDVLDAVLPALPGGVHLRHKGDEAELAIAFVPGAPEPEELRRLAGPWLIELSAAEVPDDWRQRRLRRYQPLVVADRFLVRPKWAPSGNDPGLTEIVLEPSSAFGTGLHPTTQACLAMLAEVESGDSRNTDGAGGRAGAASSPGHRLRVPAGRHRRGCVCLGCPWARGRRRGSCKRVVAAGDAMKQPPGQTRSQMPSPERGQAPVTIISAAREVEQGARSMLLLVEGMFRLDVIPHDDTIQTLVRGLSGEADAQLRSKPIGGGGIAGGAPGEDARSTGRFGGEVVLIGSDGSERAVARLLVGSVCHLERGVTSFTAQATLL